MDRETLSNYGWILIATIAVAVFIALSQPIGEYIGQVVTGVGQGMVDVGDAADEESIDEDMDELFGNDDEKIHVDITK
jgi:hypothetical protein